MAVLPQVDDLSQADSFRFTPGADESPKHSSVTEPDPSPEGEARIASVGGVHRPEKQIEANDKPDRILESVSQVQEAGLPPELLLHLLELERSLVGSKRGPLPRMNAEGRL